MPRTVQTIDPARPSSGTCRMEYSNRLKRIGKGVDHAGATLQASHVEAEDAWCTEDRRALGTLIVFIAILLRHPVSRNSRQSGIPNQRRARCPECASR
jgi:hypothetical protein